MLRLGAAVVVAAATSTIARRVLEVRLSGESFFGSLGLLLSVLVTGGVTYLLIAGKPPRMKSEIRDDTI